MRLLRRLLLGTPSLLGHSTYYYVPGIYWFYNDGWDDYYYETWYGGGYAAWPVEWRIPFKHRGAFFPTEEFRDLNLDMNGTPVQIQIEYRRSISALADHLATETLGHGGNGVLQMASVVIDHYQLILDSQGVEVEGFVSQDGYQFPFKALLDLSNPDEPEVFIPSSAQPTPEEQGQLNELNSHITDLGGVINN